MNATAAKLLNILDIATSREAEGRSKIPLTRSELRDIENGLRTKINPPPKATKLYSEFPRLQIAMEKFAENLGVVLTKAEQAKYSEKESQYAAMNELKLASTPQAAGVLFKQQGKNIRTAVQGGDVITAAKMEIESREKIEREFASRMWAAKAAQRQIGEEFRPVVLEIARRVEAAALRLHDELVAAEKKQFDKYGMPYRPGPLTIFVGQATWRFSDACKFATGASPKVQLAAIGVRLQ